MQFLKASCIIFAMKTVAVLVPSLLTEYCLNILSGISDYFRDKNVKIIISQTKVPHATESMYDYQFWSCAEYLLSKDIDAYIVLSSVYTTLMPSEDFMNFMKKLEPRPVVSISVPLPLENSYTIVGDCSSSIKETVTHLKNCHNCSRIAFFSANNVDSDEGRARYQAYLEALKENGLEFDKNLVFDGTFTNFYAHDVIREKIKSKKDLNFDAMVCVNDMTALGVLAAFKEIGISVPQDVKLTGFDDAIVATMCEPTLSTINQNIYAQGQKAADVVLAILQGKTVPKTVSVELYSKFRQSCGCIELSDARKIYKNADGAILKDSEDFGDNTFRFVDSIQEKQTLLTLLDTVEAANTLKQFYFQLKYIAQQCDFGSIYLQLSQTPMLFDENDDFMLSEKMELYMYYNKEQNAEVFRPEVFFNPHEKILSSRSIKTSSGVFIMYPVFHGQTHYGFIFCKLEKNKFADYEVHLKTLVYSIARAFEYSARIAERQSLENDNINLAMQARTDELTEVLNRRGFFEKGQAVIDLMQETDGSAIVFFADLDGLKQINDKYGHEIGDTAIKVQAESFKKVFSKKDVIGRIGGDEFGIIAIGTKRNQLDKIRLKIEMYNQILSKEYELPFTVSTSIGFVDLQKSTVLRILLSEADKVLYEEKSKKHGIKQ